MNHTMKTKLAAARSYSGVRLALNYYMYYEISTKEELFPQAAAGFHRLLKAALNGKADLKELEDLRNGLIQRMEELTAYTDSFQAYEYVLNRMEPRFSLEFLGAETEDSAAFTAEVMAYILKEKDVAAVNERIHEVIEQLPVRLTKQKFFAMTESGMSVYRGGTRSGLQDMMYVLRSEALLNRPEAATPDSGELFSLLSECREQDFKDMTAAEYRHMTAIVEQAGEILEDRISQLLTLMELIQSLYVMLLVGEETSSNEDQAVKRLLSDLHALFEQEERGEIPAAVTEQMTGLEGLQEESYERWLSTETAGDDLPIFGEIERLMSGSFFMPLQEEEKEDSVVTEEELTRELNAFFEELTQLWKTESRQMIRASMAKVLARIPVLFQSVDEFSEYITASLESCTDENERAVSIRLLRMIMEEA